MRGIIVRVGKEWLDRVGEESPEHFVLGRLDRSRPGWSEPGDPWFLLVAGTLAAQAAFVDQELLTPAEAFDQYGYGTGALSVEQLCQLIAPDAHLAEDELCGFVSLASLERWQKPSRGRELTEHGAELPAGEGLTRLTEEQTQRLIAAGRA